MGEAGPQFSKRGQGLSRVRLPGWQMLDEILADDGEYLLLRRVQPPSSGVEALTTRELDALRRAWAGASNKEIAYMMGISASTVGVLLARARRKIGMSGRSA